MKKIIYNKLIRDKIPEVIKKSGGIFEIRKLKNREYGKELIRKVGEEASGLLSAKNRKELILELADVLAVIDEIIDLKKISTSEIRAAKKENWERKGGFRKKLFLAWASDTGYKTNERTCKN